MTTLRVNKAPTALRLTDEQWPLYRTAGDWARMFNPADVSNAVPWLFWLLALEALGLSCFALLFRALPALPIGGMRCRKSWDC